MQNYYRVLGISPTASVPQIEQAYVRQRTRLRRLAAADPAMKARLAEVEAGFGILAHPRRRLAYDVLLAQEPAVPMPSRRRLVEERLAHYAVWGRRLNAALLACCLLLALDWALPPREYAHETVQSRFPVSVSASLSDPQLAYRVRTAHTTFRLPSAIGDRVRQGQALVVWQTPLLGVVQRISAPNSQEGAAPFQPYGGTIYGAFLLLPLLLGGVAAVGLWPRATAETVVNTAAVAGLLAILVLAVVLSF